MGMILFLLPLATILAPFALAFEAIDVTFSPFAQVLELWVNYFMS